MTAVPRNPLQALAGYHLRRASAAAMDDLARELSALELRPTEASILLLVGANPAIRSIEVGRELGVQRANMTPLIAALERRGVIAREAADGRSQALTLTPAGQALCEAAHAVMQAHDARLLAGLEPTLAAQAPELLARLWSAG